MTTAPDGSDLIEITGQMLKVGADELREKHFGEPLEQVVYNVYLLMELERRDQVRAAASARDSSR